MVRAGWFKPAKLVIYPIRDAIDSSGRQLINWVVEIETLRNRPPYVSAYSAIPR